MKKISALLACIGLIMTTAVGCQESTPKNVLRVGMECGYAPFNWSDAKANSTNVKIKNSGAYCDGYDVSIAKALAEDLDLKLEIHQMDFDGLIPALNFNQIDVIIAGMSPTAKRMEEVNFTNEYYNSDQVIIVKDSSKYATATKLSDFAGATLAAQQGTLQDSLIEANKTEAGFKHGTPYPTYPESFIALSSGVIDGVVAEYPVAKSVTTSNSGLKIIKFESGNGFAAADEDVLVSIGVRKSDNELLDKLNLALEKISKEQRETLMQQALERQPISE